MGIFKIHTESKTTKARTGVVTLPRGEVQTPIFMPIGTAGTVKGLNYRDLLSLHAEIILGNTYHLWLRPGVNVIQKAGGLHAFEAWDKPILTDSGGFQAFSLSKVRKFTEEGVEFRSVLDGSKKFLSPEISMQIQSIIGSDIALVLDELLAAEVSFEEARSAMWRTRRWAERSKKAFEHIRNRSPHKNILFGIPQGAQFIELRKQSAELTMEVGFEGYSIGGVANGGEPEEVMYAQVDSQTDILEKEKPRHLLGVGTPKDIVQMVARGVDMFDCVYPTRNARHGSLMYRLDDTTYETVQIKSARFGYDFTPINPSSRFEELRVYSKSYLRHLFRSGELLSHRLTTLHNLEFYFDLMEDIRNKITLGKFDQWWMRFDFLKAENSNF